MGFGLAARGRGLVVEMGDCCNSCRTGGACESGCQSASAPPSAGLGDPPHKRATRVNTQGHAVARTSGDGTEMIFGVPRATFEHMGTEAQERLIRQEYAQDEARMLAALSAMRNGVDTLRAWIAGDQRLRQEQIRQDAETRRAQINADAQTEQAYINRQNPAPPPPPPPPATPAATPAPASDNGALYLVGGLALLAVVYAVTRSAPTARPTPNPDPPRMASGHGRCQCNGRGSYYNRASGKFARCPCRGG